MSSLWSRLCLLMWKNWLLQRRHLVQTIIEVSVPIILSVVLILIRNSVTTIHYNEPTRYKAFSTKCTKWEQNWTIAWSPYHPELANVMSRAALVIGYEQESFDNSSLLFSRLSKPGAMKKYIAGITFDDEIAGREHLSRQVTVTIRFPGAARIITRYPQENIEGVGDTNWRTYLMFPLYQQFGPREKACQAGGEPGYCKEGFLQLQDAVSKAYIEHFTTSVLPIVEFERFPYPPYVDDPMQPALTAFISTIILLSFVYPAINTTKAVAVEKETKMKEAMKLMGLPNHLHWLAWTLKSQVLWLIPSVMIVGLLTVPLDQGCVIRFSNPWVCLFVLVVYSFSAITQCFLISVLFNHGSTAATVGGLIWFGTYAPYIILQPKYFLMSFREKIYTCIFSNSAMGYAFQNLLMFEGTGEGGQWHNVWKPVTPDDSLCLGHILLMMFLMGVLHILATLYIESVWPGPSGIPLPWYYPIQATYWLGYKYKFKDIVNASGIQLRGLTKIYKNGKKAVDHLTMDMYQNQITVLLGHNGAGKSTTMSMLTGLITPTSGTAYIDGHDIWYEMDKVRKSLGLCPQYNLLFEELTVEDHLLFFAKLKRLGGEELRHEIKKYIQTFGLEHYAKTKATVLSGGLKRKLSVAIALIANSKVVLLDEPTSGMDPAARRELWDILQSERQGRTIVMTTHLMDEADLLGDRIAIINNGQLKAIGTPFSLKKDYGEGYSLTLIKDIKGFCETKVTAYIQKFCSDCEAKWVTDNEVRYKLTDSSLFPELLKNLEEKQNELHIKEYGLSLTTMEDVFMRVGRDNKDQEFLALPPALSRDADSLKTLSSEATLQNISERTLSTEAFYDEDFFKTDEWTQSTGFHLWFRQYQAIMTKKYLYTKSLLYFHLLQVIMTILFLSVSIFVVRTWQGQKDLPPFTMDLSAYESPVTTITMLDQSETSEAFYYTFKNITRHAFVDLALQGPYVPEYILNKSIESITEVSQRYIAGLSFSDRVITAHFNNQPYHAPPLVLNMIHNIMFNALTGTGARITLINYPLPYGAEEKMIRLQGGSNMGFQVAFNLGFSQAFICAIMILFAVKERETGFKHLQLVSGAKPSVYWLASVSWDFITYCLIIATVLCTLLSFNEPGFKEFGQLMRVAMVMLAFAWAIIPMMSLMSYCFTSPSTSFTRTSLFNIATGAMGFIVQMIMDIPPLSLKKEAERLNDNLIIFPHYALSNGIRNIYLSHELNNMCDFNATNNCFGWDGDNYSWKAPGIRKNLTYLFIVGLIFHIILISIEYLKILWLRMIWFKNRYCKIFNRSPVGHDMTTPFLIEDSDVQMEKVLVKNSSPENYAIYINDLVKTYNGVEAVKGIDLVLNAKECFGLLGSNGAGKSSTFKMLTGDTLITSGNAYICNKMIKTSMNKIRRTIGYCPQFDALLEELTGRETLQLFCNLRGLPIQEIHPVIRHLSTKLMFHHYLDVKVKHYSGGNKRKLSTAVALIGNPPVVLLDEPTSGLDPAARRHLWNVISSERDSGKCIVVTSHSLEECEALCTRLAVMVNGRLSCLGSVQHLKNKFAVGYQLQIKFPPTTQQNIKWFIAAYLIDSEVVEEYEGMVTFHVPPGIACSQVFSVMERAKTESLVEDYSIQQTSLEQVFLRFTTSAKSNHTRAKSPFNRSVQTMNLELAEIHL